MSYIQPISAAPACAGLSQKPKVLLGLAAASAASWASIIYACIYIYGVATHG